MKARVIAFYLPQFHPTEINDKYWGKGFTEWTNVAKSKPLYNGHYQPQIPADLGFYDLRVPEIREQQAEMARKYGVEGFLYWNYWFGRGKKVLEMPIEEIMKTGKPDYPFCVGWANHDWSNKTWEKSPKYKEEIVFLKQEYLGENDYRDYFNYLLPMFKDKRYITVDGKPLFYIYAPHELPDAKMFIELFNRLAVDNGLSGIHFVARVDPYGRLKLSDNNANLDKAKERINSFIEMGFDAVNTHSFTRAELLTSGRMLKFIRAFRRRIFGYSPNIYDYEKVMKNYYLEEDSLEFVYPQIIPRIDKTPRFGKNSLIYSNSTPEKFRSTLKEVFPMLSSKADEHKIVFLNSWNEWGEGAYMEPDLVYGHQYLQVLKDEVFEKYDFI